MERFDNIFRLGTRAAEENISSEDLFTAQLAWLLRMDEDLRKNWCALLSGRAPLDCDNAAVILWPYPGADRPDMLIDLGERGKIVCEHKLDSGFGKDQIPRYLRLVETEANKNGQSHHLAAITKDPVKILPEWSGHPCYLQPDGSNHFRWEQLYEVIKSLPEPAHPHLVTLRQQFLDYMRILSLDPCPLLPRFSLLFAEDDEKERLAQRKAFANLPGSTRHFFEDRGYQMQGRSHMDLTAYATDVSEITSSKDLAHISLTPSNIRPQNLRDDLPWPLIEVNVAVLPHEDTVLRKLNDLSYPLKYGDVSVRVPTRCPIPYRLHFSNI